MQIGEVNKHVGLQNNGFLASGQLAFAIHYSEGGVHCRMQSIDFHDHRVQIRHLRIYLREISGVDGVDFGHEFFQTLGVLVEFDQ